MSRHWWLLVVLACAACSKDADKAPAPATPATAGTPAVAPPAPAATTAAARATAPEDRVFSREELAQMVAPIALYPDPLLAQVLMAATYPGDVADAATWAKANPKQSGDAAVRAVADQPWDPSVQSLAAFPQVLAMLGQDPGWVQKLGDAFLAQPDQVMDAVQVLRHKAKDEGNLASNEYQNVSVEPASASAAAPAPAPEAAPGNSGAGAYSEPALAATTDTIVIQPSNPEVVYVPTYNPTTAYGAWSYPSYPPPYYPPSPAWYPGSALVSGLAWGTGMAIAGSLWGDMDWGGDDIDINVNSYNSFNSNRQISRTDNTWQHNAANRDGVPYRDQRSREQYSNRLANDPARDRMRGDDPERARQREQARSSMDRRGMEAPARTNREAQQRAQTAQRDIAQRDIAQRGGADAARAGGGRDAQREQARQAGANRQAAQRQQQNRPTQHRQSGANNTASRNNARQQAQRQQHSQSSAFNGARQPQQSRAAQQRGQASQNRSRQQASRPQQQRSQQVNRQPRSGGGGQQHARSGGAQRSGGGHRR